MYRKLISTLAAALISSAAFAHEWTPTYPKFESSYMDGVLMTTMTLFNKREDISYYEISIFDSEWNPIEFAAAERLINVKYTERKNIDLYVRASDVDRIEYICSLSKILSSDVETSGLATKICSRVK